MAVLVTRPGEQGRELCHQLNRAGICALHHCLIEIRPGEDLPGISSQLAQFDLIIAVSQHAVTLTQKAFLPQQKWPKAASYIAVGQKTAHVLSKLSQQKVHYPDVGDSEHLLKLDILKNVKDKKVVILRGNGGRELIYESLKSRGAQVRYFEVYKRENLAFDSDLLVPLWQDKDIQQLVITSSGQLSYFVSQLTPAQLNWAFGLQLHVPSERIANEAQQLGFLHVNNTGSASNKDLLATLRPK
ncbi:uroporphyrinogen-III synthase [Vibrio sp. Isolate24]|uniref:uroporphyrinogen-III synthase n=1 Tax=Vibrio sp. Isolate24 TaxID=2908534 RepID=UPI001EFE3465|nr:uroporphyrinogen-III synthase [Vibrio sp. Isolate24]MCG9680694.1 uroporphyrinogen-III synthase [Vibrio sp. Isolate24]